jgi:hypothetical protein
VAWRRFAIFGTLAAAVVVLTGCGSSQSTADQQWILDVNGLAQSAKGESSKSLEQLHAAGQSGNPNRIAAAFGSYAAFLGDFEQKFKAFDPPERCRGLAQTLVGFMDRLRSKAQQLSSPSAVDTYAELQQGGRAFARIQKSYFAHFAPLAHQKHC